MKSPRLSCRIGGATDDKRAIDKLCDSNIINANSKVFNQLPKRYLKTRTFIENAHVLLPAANLVD